MAWSLIHGRDDRVSILLNNVAHRSDYINEATLDLEQIRQAIRDLGEVALSLDDEDGAAQITQNLGAMSREAVERFNRWDPTKRDLGRDVAKNTIAHRYLTASQDFWNIAELKDGTAYRRELWYLRSEANGAHEGWRMAQCKRFEDAKRLLM